MTTKEQEKAVAEVAEIFGQMRDAVFDAFIPSCRPETDQQNLLAAILTVAAVERLRRKD